MELNSKAKMYLGVSFTLWVFYLIIDHLLSRKVFWNDFLFEQPINPPLKIEILLTFLMGFRYILLFFSILFYFLSLYSFFYAYPNKRNKTSLILNLLILPLFLILGIIINPPTGEFAGLIWIYYLLIILPACSIIFLGISFFISKISFNIDLSRKKEGRKSIFFLPLIISSILFLIYSGSVYFNKYSGQNNSMPIIAVDLLTGFSNALPFVFVYVPFTIISFFVGIYYFSRRRN